MQICVHYGRESVDFDVSREDLLPVRREPEAESLADPAAAVRAALESPHNFPPLRRALTPDDHIAVVVDEGLPDLAALLVPLLEHIGSAGIPPSAVTLVCPTAGDQPWLEDLPEEFEDVSVEVHDPDDRRKLAYLATTKGGRRLYLNRSAVDADQLIVLSRLRYDPTLGYAGAETAIYPALADRETIEGTRGRPSLKPAAEMSGPLHEEAAEVVWHLGVPFFVQVIEGPDAETAHVLAGPLESVGEGRRLLDARWRVEVDEPADVVVASLGGDPARHGLPELARALANSARVVKPQGKIVLLTESAPSLDEAAGYFQQPGNGGAGEQGQAQGEILYQWARASEQATIYLLSRLPAETAEELLTVPLRRAEEAQKLLREGATCVFLPEAHKLMAVVGSGRASEKVS